MDTNFTGDKSFRIGEGDYNKETHVMVRLQTAIDLPAKITKTDGKYTIDPPVEGATKVKSVIFYCHGGGFFSMSSFNHQNYTRIFANETKIPVISCDYRLTKKNSDPFPTCLNDCF